MAGGKGREPANGKEGGVWQSIDMQIAALAAMMVATGLSVSVLLAVRNREKGLGRRGDDVRIDRLPRVSAALTAAAALYFLCLAWADHQRWPDSRTLTWLFVANAFAVGASAIKLDVLFAADGNGEVIEEAVE